MITTDRGRRAAAVLFVVTAALFAMGVALENNTHDEPAVERGAAAEVQPAADAAEAHDEGADEAGGATEEGRGTDGAETGHDGSSENETLLGIDVESPVTVALVVVASAGLAAGLWATKQRVLAIAAVVVGGLFALFDIA